MKAIDIPVKFAQPFAFGAGGSFIRQVPFSSQIGIQDGAASITTGFPPLNFLPVAAGGVPPFGEDMNGLLNQSTAWDRWCSTGGPIKWDSAQSVAISGYPAGAIVQSTVTFGLSFFCLIDDNTTNPDSGGAGWAPFWPVGFSTGDAKLTFKNALTASDAGWLLINADPFTIGSAASGASYAAADAVALYTLLWTNVSNSFAPVSTGRGVNPAADFAANKTLGIPRLLGRALAIAGSGTSLTSRALGQFLGEETHLMTLAELVTHAHNYVDPTHFHGVNDPGHVTTTLQTASVYAAGTNPALQAGGSGHLGPDFTGISIQSATVNITISNAGSSTPFNVMQPTSFLNIMVHL